MPHEIDSGKLWPDRERETKKEREGELSLAAA